MRDGETIFPEDRGELINGGVGSDESDDLQSPVQVFHRGELIDVTENIFQAFERCFLRNFNKSQDYTSSVSHCAIIYK